MKKVIFLLVFFVSSVFGGSISVENIYDNTSSWNNVCEVARTENPRTEYDNKSACASVGLYAPSNSSVPENTSCTQVYFYFVKPDSCVPDSGGYRFMEQIKRTSTLTFQCIQPSGGCPVGQTFDEQTCTCKCNPLPNYSVLLSPPVTQHSDCILTNPDIVVSDGLLGYIGDVSWSSCESKCYGSTTPCPPHTAIVNGSCQIPPSPPCTGSSSSSFGGVTGPSGEMCYIHFFCNGTEIGRQQVSCDTSTPDSNSTGNPDSNSTGTGTGTGDSNSTGTGTGTGDSNSTGSGSGSTTTTTGGDGGGSTSGDSNSTGTGTGTGDSNSTGTGTGGGSGATGNLDFLSDAISDILSKYVFNFSMPTCPRISTITVTCCRRNVDIFSQEIVDILPMSAIKTFIIFVFTLFSVTLAFKGGD